MACLGQGHQRWVVGRGPSQLSPLWWLAWVWRVRVSCGSGFHTYSSGLFMWQLQAVGAEPSHVGCHRESTPPTRSDLPCAGWRPLGPRGVPAHENSGLRACVPLGALSPGSWFWGLLSRLGDCSQRQSEGPEDAWPPFWPLADSSCV